MGRLSRKKILLGALLQDWMEKDEANENDGLR
jgi:hypothetical protein